MKTERTREELELIYAPISRLLMERGPKSCTMDLVAAALGMSKRTLYEIFGSKEEMTARIMDYIIGKTHEQRLQNFSMAADTMEALVREVFSIEQFMQSVSPDFLRDMHRLPTMRDCQRRSSESQYRAVSIIIDRGVREGVFRPDMDYNVVIRMLIMQYESLKCVPDFFPEGVTVPYAFRCISICFLRSIATPRGMEILDRLTPELTETSKISTSATPAGETE